MVTPKLASPWQAESTKARGFIQSRFWRMLSRSQQECEKVWRKCTGSLLPFEAGISKPSIQSLLIELQVNGHRLARGTAFVANSPRGPVLVTSRHNLAGRHCETNKCLSPTGGVPSHVRIFHNHKDGIGQWIDRTEPLYSGDQPLWFEHPTLGSKADIVALPLVQLDDVELYPHSLGAGDRDFEVFPSENVSVVGFPFGLQGGGSYAIWATGFLATEPHVNYGGLPVMLIDCRARQGQSGSAVIAYRANGVVPGKLYSGPVSRFLGIYSGRINEQSDLGFVWKASAIQELVNAISA
jgi:hypothetical protein